MTRIAICPNCGKTHMTRSVRTRVLCPPCRAKHDREQDTIQKRLRRQLTVKARAMGRCHYSGGNTAYKVVASPDAEFRQDFLNKSFPVAEVRAMLSYDVIPDGTDLLRDGCRYVARDKKLVKA